MRRSRGLDDDQPEDKNFILAKTFRKFLILDHTQRVKHVSLFLKLQLRQVIDKMHEDIEVAIIA